MEHVQIRPFRRSDEGRVREILEVSWHGQGAAWFFEQTFGMLGGRPWFEWFWPGIETKLERHPEWVFVTDVDGRVAGVVTLALDHTLGLGSIGYNAVDPAWRGRGLGRRQIEFIMQQFQRQKMRCVGVYVALNDGHRAARAIYEKVGCRTVATIETRYARLPKCPPNGPCRDAGKIRPAERTDQEAIRALVERTLSRRHPYAVIERRHGDIWAKPWPVRVMDGLRPAIESGSGDVLLCEQDGTCTGVAATAASPERGTGFISLLEVDPAARGTAADVALMATAARRFAAQGLCYLQLSTYIGEDGSGPSRALVDAFGLATLVMRSEYKFRMLVPELASLPAGRAHTSAAAGAEL